MFRDYELKMQNLINIPPRLKDTETAVSNFYNQSVKKEFNANFKASDLLYSLSNVFRFVAVISSDIHSTLFVKSHIENRFNFKWSFINQTLNIIYTYFKRLFTYFWDMVLYPTTLLFLNVFYHQIIETVINLVTGVEGKTKLPLVKGQPWYHILLNLIGYVLYLPVEIVGYAMDIGAGLVLTVLASISILLAMAVNYYIEFDEGLVSDKDMQDVSGSIEANKYIDKLKSTLGQDILKYENDQLVLLLEKNILQKTINTKMKSKETGEIEPDLSVLDKALKDKSGTESIISVLKDFVDNKLPNQVGLSISDENFNSGQEDGVQSDDESDDDEIINNTELTGVNVKEPIVPAGPVVLSKSNEALDLKLREAMDNPQVTNEALTRSEETENASQNGNNDSASSSNVGFFPSAKQEIKQEEMTEFLGDVYNEVLRDFEGDHKNDSQVPSQTPGNNK